MITSLTTTRSDTHFATLLQQEETTKPVPARSHDNTFIPHPL